MKPPAHTQSQCENERDGNSNVMWNSHNAEKPTNIRCYYYHLYLNGSGVFYSVKAKIAYWLQVEAENRIINQDGTFVCAPFKWGVENVIKGIFSLSITSFAATLTHSLIRVAPHPPASSLLLHVKHYKSDRCWHRRFVIRFTCLCECVSIARFHLFNLQQVCETVSYRL